MADPVFAMVAMVALVALIEMYLKSKREFEGPLVCKLHSFGLRSIPDICHLFYTDKIFGE